MKKYIRSNEQLKSAYELSHERLASIADSISIIVSGSESNEVKLDTIEHILKFYNLI